MTNWTEKRRREAGFARLNLRVQAKTKELLQAQADAEGQTVSTWVEILAKQAKGKKRATKK